MLRTGRSRHPHEMLVAPLRYRHFYRCREPRYRGPWHLPGPDLHRLAILGLAPGYIQSPFHSLGDTFADARAAGRTLEFWNPTRREKPQPAQLRGQQLAQRAEER